LYIEESRAVYGASEEKKMTNRALIAEACERYGFSLTLMPIEKIFEVSHDAKNEPPENMDDVKYKRINPEVSLESTASLQEPERLEEYT